MVDDVMGWQSAAASQARIGEQSSVRAIIAQIQCKVKCDLRSIGVLSKSESAFRRMWTPAFAGVTMADGVPVIPA
jgi:hypothetical protein